MDEIKVLLHAIETLRPELPALVGAETGRSSKPSSTLT